MRPATQIAVQAEAALVSGTRVAAADFRTGLAGPVGVAGARGLAALVGERVERSVMASPFGSTGLVGTLKRNVAVDRSAFSILLRG
jgi:hypothetical protein